MPHPDPTLPSLPDVEVRESPIHGRGAFARRDLPGQWELGVYAGRRYSPEEATEVEWDSALTYLFALSDGTLVDGGNGGNATRHLNHACEPNCEAIEDYAADDSLELRIHTTRPVSAGEELFLDYALIIDPSEEPSLYPCNCGAASCRRTMAAAEG